MGDTTDIEPPLTCTWLGHASIELSGGGTRILIDPLLRRRVGMLVHRAPQPMGDVSPDAVLITHLHSDHCDIPTLRAIGLDVPLVVPTQTAAWFARRGFTDVSEIEIGQTMTIGSLEIEAVEADHVSPAWSPVRRGMTIGFVIEAADAPGTRIYVAGDTDVFAGMEQIGDRGIDLALLPIGGWGPRVPEGHLNTERAAEAARMLRAARVVPVHWGTLRPIVGGAIIDAIHGREAQRFEHDVERLAPGVDVIMLEPGGSLGLGD